MKSVIIGLGAISQTHINALVKCDIAEIAGVCDIKEEKVNSVVSQLGGNVKGYCDYKAMIDEICPDVVHICTPHYLHRDMAIYSMEHGAHVYLEKPVALNAEQANEIVQVSKKTGKKVCVSFQNRVIPTNYKAKEYVENGLLGKLLGVRGSMTWKRGGAYYTQSGWRGTWEKEGGGVLMNQSIHTLDMMYFLCGKVKDVKGSVALRKNAGTIEVEDTAEATIWFENGTTGIFYATNCNVADSSVEIEIYFEKGRLLLINDTLIKTENGKTEIMVENKDYSKTIGKAAWGNGHAIMIDSFYSSLKGNEQYYCELEDAIPVLEIVEKIYASSPEKLR